MNPTDMGPLPLGDRQDTQQQLSLKALRNRMPEDKFLVRDERTDDKGVDVALEVKVEVRVPTKSGGEEVMHAFTNCRAQGQLKSIDAPEPNVDGSVSYSIDTSNLNYLLNGQSPLYFLWLAPTNEIRYAWAKDEWRRLDVEKPEWMKQGTFTIRFRTVLDAAAIDTIYERIVKEARFARTINEILAQGVAVRRGRRPHRPSDAGEHRPTEALPMDHFQRDDDRLVGLRGEDPRMVRPAQP